MKYRHLLSLSLSSAILVAGCTDLTSTLPLTAPEPLASGSVRGYVVQEPGATADRVVLTIHIFAKDVQLGAYQGRLEFASGSLEILEARTPSDGTRLVNAAAAPGVVKIAGFSTDAFTGTAAATLVVKPLQPLDPANLRVTLDVVGEKSGIAVAKSRLVATQGMYLTAPAAP